jgi:hypothetical protein
VNADGLLSPLDALLITNYLNLNGTVTLPGEGEGEGFEGSGGVAVGMPSGGSGQEWLGAFQQWEDEWTSRRRTRR